MADTVVDAPPGYTKGGIKIGSVVDAPPGYNPTSPTPPKPGKSLLQNIGDVASGAYRNINAARTAAARDPVGALGNVLGAPEGAVAGAAMAPLEPKHRTDDFGQFLKTIGHGIVGGATNPQERNRYNEALGNLTFGGMRPQGEGMPARIGRGVEDFGAQTLSDPITHGGGKIAEGLISAAKPVAGAVARGVKPVGDYATAVRSMLSDPKLAPAVGKTAHALSTLTAPLKLESATARSALPSPLKSPTATDVGPLPAL